VFTPYFVFEIHLIVFEKKSIVFQKQLLIFEKFFKKTLKNTQFNGFI